MLARDFRKLGYDSLQGKWGSLALITLIYMIIVGAVGAIPEAGGVASVIIDGPMLLGYIMVILKLLRKEEFRVENLFDGFKNFVPAMVLQLVNALLVALWSLLLIVPGIIKGLSYALSFYILADNPDWSQSECRRKSMEMMDGHKGRLFCLELSFIGWWCLCILTCGILTFWVVPYVNASVAAFYEDLKRRQLQQEASCCVYCGAPKEEGAAFCRICGKDLRK